MGIQLDRFIDRIMEFNIFYIHAMLVNLLLNWLIFQNCLLFPENNHRVISNTRQLQLIKLFFSNIYMYNRFFFLICNLIFLFLILQFYDYLILYEVIKLGLHEIYQALISKFETTSRQNFYLVVKTISRLRLSRLWLLSRFIN